MSILHILRHAKSSWDEPAPDDRLRPLASRGIRNAQRMAGHLEQAGVRPGLVLCSSALRTRQTLELVRPALGDPGTLIEDGLYAASAGELLDRLRRLPAAVGSAMLIGHNPGLQELVLLRAMASPELGVIEVKFPTCALASLDSGAVGWAELDTESARLTGYTTARSLD